jgi:hypothetical protein
VLRRALRLVVEHEELVGSKRELSVRLPLVVGELDLVGAIQKLNDRSNLTAQDTVNGQIDEQGDDIE